jgi:hypothetical protein
VPRHQSAGACPAPKADDAEEQVGLAAAGGVGDQRDHDGADDAAEDQDAAAEAGLLGVEAAEADQSASVIDSIGWMQGPARSAARGLGFGWGGMVFR